MTAAHEGEHMNDVRPGSVLPVPDRAHQGPVAYDAKKLDERFPPIEPARPPVQARMCS